MFVVEYTLGAGFETTAWTVLVCNGVWIYRDAAQASEVMRSCEPDHDDPFSCDFRVREVDCHEALRLVDAVKSPVPLSGLQRVGP